MTVLGATVVVCSVDSVLLTDELLETVGVASDVPPDLGFDFAFDLGLDFAPADDVETTAWPAVRVTDCERLVAAVLTAPDPPQPVIRNRQATRVAAARRLTTPERSGGAIRFWSRFGMGTYAA